jgi:ribosomal protein S27AE
MREQIANQREKAMEILGRMEEQRSNLKIRIEEVNNKIVEVEERNKNLNEREKITIKSSEEIKAKKSELLKWENEIIEKDKDIANKTKTILERENELQNKERQLNERESELNQTDEKRLTKEKELTDREGRLLEKEKSIQEEFEKLAAMRVKFSERESMLMETEKTLAEGEDFEPLEKIPSEIGDEGIENIAKELESEKTSAPTDEPELISVEETTIPESPESEAAEKPTETKVETSEPENPESEAAERPTETKVETSESESPESEAPETTLESLREETPAEEIPEDEKPCPNCSTLINKEASVCYACGSEVAPEKTLEEEIALLGEPTEESRAESEFLELEKKEEKGEEQVLPNKEDLYTMREEQLVAICASLGLDTSGREKHLRERIIIHMEGGATSEETVGSTSDEEAEKATCPDCDGELTYIEQYDRWYCYNCEKYAPREQIE